MIKFCTIDEETEGRRLASAIHKRFAVNASVTRDGNSESRIVVTHDTEVGGEQLKRIRRYAQGWQDSLAEQR